MTKIAIITDTHFGARNSNLALMNYFEKFYNDVFFPTLEERGVNRIIHLGDLVDHRKYINFNTLHHMHECFFKLITEKYYEIDILLGNHDSYFKDTNKINSLRHLFLGYSEKIRVWWENPVEVKIDGAKILLCPWISLENQERSIEMIRNTDAEICMGHFEIEGFEMHRGSVCDHGMKMNLFSKFVKVFSGHFHHKSSSNGIHYLGAPYEMTWSDYNDERGFHIFDTETYELEFIPNPYSIHQKLYYNEDDFTIEGIQKLDVSSIENCYVKVIVEKKTNSYMYDIFQDVLEKANPLSLTFIDETARVANIEDETILNQAQDTPTLLRQYVKSLNVEDDAKEVDKTLMELYNEALTLE